MKQEIFNGYFKGEKLCQGRDSNPRTSSWSRRAQFRFLLRGHRKLGLEGFYLSQKRLLGSLNYQLPEGFILEIVPTKRSIKTD